MAITTLTTLGRPSHRPVVLLGFAEALAAPEAAFSLMDAGYEVVLFSRRGARSPLRRVRGVRLEEIAAPEADVASTVRDLERLAETAHAAVVMPLDDMSVWLGNRVFAESAIPVAGPVGNHATFALDKRLQLQAAARAGFDVPETRIVESTGQLLGLDLDFPLIVKPILAAREDGGRLGKSSFRICGSRKDLEETVRRVQLDEGYLVQPRIGGPDAVSSGWRTEES